MSVKTLCDECTQPVPASYLHVGEAGMRFDYHTNPIPEDGLDFCNVTCLGSWAMFRATKHEGES